MSAITDTTNTTSTNTTTNSTSTNTIQPGLGYVEIFIIALIMGNLTRLINIQMLL